MSALRHVPLLRTHLSPSAYAVWRELAERQGEWVSRTEMSEVLYRSDFGAQAGRVISVYVCQLRKLLPAGWEIGWRGSDLEGKKGRGGGWILRRVER